MDVSDILEEVLSRLLVKDLLRCESVCKSWYSLISSPSFVKTHCEFMSNKEEYNTTRIAMIPFWPGSGHVWSMEGSCNGLVCIYGRSKNQIIVTNPLTREFRELAKPPVRVSYSRCMGFGYDSSTDDYKVVMARRTGSDRLLVYILSLKSNIWKLFGQINYTYTYWHGLEEPASILFNGALHWFWFDATYPLRGKASIVSFDLAKEEFREIPQPDDTRYVWNSRNSLGIIQGSLCIFIKTSHYAKDPPCRIWVMKNYNGKPSWELLPISNYCEMKDHAIHYIPPPTKFYDNKVQLPRSKEHISSPIFVQTLVSPYANYNEETVLKPAVLKPAVLRLQREMAGCASKGRDRRRRGSGVVKKTKKIIQQRV